MERIRAIRLAGFEVGHVIHRHGMDDKTALEVEAAVMDAYPGLTNVAAGAGNERGAMHAKEVLDQYGAADAVFHHKAVLINVNRSALAEGTLYEATRYAWKISKDRATPLSANVRETRSTQRIRVGRRQRNGPCWDCEREWKRMVVPLDPGRSSEARQLLRTRR